LTLLCFQYPLSFEANYFKHDVSDLKGINNFPFSSRIMLVHPISSPNTFSAWTEE